MNEIEIGDVVKHHGEEKTVAEMTKYDMMLKTAETFEWVSKTAKSVKLVRKDASKFPVGARVRVVSGDFAGRVGNVVKANPITRVVDLDATVSDSSRTGAYFFDALEQIEGGDSLSLKVIKISDSATSGEATHDAVNHPKHYNTGLMIHTVCGKPIEVIDTIEHLSGNLFNVVKYVQRAGHKGDDKTIEDLGKALWYLQREIERMKRETARVAEEEGKL